MPLPTTKQSSQTSESGTSMSRPTTPVASDPATMITGLQGMATFYSSGAALAMKTGRRTDPFKADEGYQVAMENFKAVSSPQAIAAALQEERRYPRQVAAALLAPQKEMVTIPTFPTTGTPDLTGLKKGLCEKA